MRGGPSCADQLTLQDVESLWNEHVGFGLSEKALAELNSAIISDLSGKKKSKAIAAVILDFINETTKTGWTTNGHNADDVQVFAYGVGSEHFKGNQDNTDLAKKLISLLPSNK